MSGQGDGGRRTGLSSAEREARDRAWEVRRREDAYLTHPMTFSAGFECGVEYARGATVAEIVEWLRTREADDALAVSYGQTTYYDNGVRAADAIGARFSPAPPEREEG